MRQAIWVASGVLAFGIVSLASAQNPSSFSPSNLSSALTGAKPTDIQFRTPDGKLLPKGTAPSAPNAANAKASSFRFGDFLPRLFIRPTRNSTSTAAFQPVMPVMSTVENSGKAISILGSASGPRGSSFQLPTPITGR